MRITQIINDVGTVKLIDSDGIIYSLIKSNIEYAKISNGFVFLFAKNISFSLDFNSITDPVTASAEELLQAIEAMLDVGASIVVPSGAALEAGNLAALVAKDFATQGTLNSFNSKLTTEVHVRVHSGVYYYCGDAITLNSTQTRDILLITDPLAVKRPHFFLEIFAFNGNNNKSFNVDVFEDATVSSNGTSLGTFNLNRTGAASTVTVFHTPTVTTTGASICAKRTGLKEFKLLIRQGEEYVLKTNTKYLIRITSLINNNDIQSNLGWYEN